MSKPTLADTPPLRRRGYLRHTRLQELGYRNYQHYLKSPAWKATKSRYLADPELPQACICDATEGLQLHHKTYERVGKEHLTDLVPLCAPCHQAIHALERRGDIGLDFEGLLDRARAEVGRARLAADKQQLEAETQQRRTEFLAYLQSLPFDVRLARAIKTAKARHANVTRPVRVLSAHLRQGSPRAKLQQRLDTIEAIAYAHELGHPTYPNRARPIDS